jgi:hypothetical protein
MTKLAPSRERWFPAFDSADYAVTSEETIAYNCFAWALDVSAWIEPDDNEPFALFERAGYRVVSDATLEPGIQKIVVYADEVGFTHAARQLPTGRWTSKLGSWEDIEQAEPFDLTGPLYGTLFIFMARQLGGS